MDGARRYPPAPGRAAGADAAAPARRGLRHLPSGTSSTSTWAATPRAVPEVDELVALPLDLYAGEHGLTKITPNLMGF